MSQPASESSPRRLSRAAGAFYLVNIVTALVAFSGKGGRSLGLIAGLLATLSYLAVTVLLYLLFKRVSRRISLVAAAASVAGCLAGILNARHILPVHIHSLVFFGIYCVLIGWLILRSGDLPPILGILMCIAGAGWLTFVSPSLAAALSPYHYIAGGVGEGLLTLWLLFAGVDGSRHRPVPA